MAISPNDWNWETGRLCLVWLLGNNSVLFRTLNVVAVSYWLQDHLLQQVDKDKTKFSQTGRLECALGKVYPLIRIVLVCGLVDQLI